MLRHRTEAGSGVREGTSADTSLRPGAGGEPLIPGCEGVKRSIIERVAIWFHRLPAAGASGRTNRRRDEEHTRAFTVHTEGRTNKFCPEASAAAGTATESPRLQWNRLMINDRAVVSILS